MGENSLPLSFRIFHPASCRFPSPRVPLLAPPGRASFGLSRGGRFKAVGDGAGQRFYSRGRYALLDAFRLAGVGVEGALLAPAYHCRTMIDPAVSLGGEVLLYALDRQLAPDLASLAELADACRRPVRALLLTHYFGFPQNADPIKAFCAARGIVLIEDCSHAYLQSAARPALGIHGQFVVASPYKFSPAEDGGILVAKSGHFSTLPPLRGRGVVSELKGLVRWIQRGLAARKPFVVQDALDEEIDRVCSVLGDRGTESEQAGNTTSAMYDSGEEGMSGLMTSRWIIQASEPDRIAESRRRNFAAWLAAVDGLPGCRPLFSQLPPDVVPYMFPLYVDLPDPHFYNLKRVGLPIWRWDEMGISECPVSMDYRLHLFHLPCHQALRPTEMAWMVRVLKKVMLHRPPADPAQT